MAERTLRVCALYPDLMNIYADRGNLLLLERRCAWRGIGFRVVAAGLGGQRVGVEAIELDDVVAHRSRAVGGDDLAHALDRRAIAEVAHGDRPACVYDAFDLAQIGHRG